MLLFDIVVIRNGTNNHCTGTGYGSHQKWTSNHLQVLDMVVIRHGSTTTVQVLDTVVIRHGSTTTVQVLDTVVIRHGSTTTVQVLDMVVIRSGTNNHCTGIGYGSHQKWDEQPLCRYWQAQGFFVSVLCLVSVCVSLLLLPFHAFGPNGALDSHCVPAVIFVLDSSNRERVTEAQNELVKLVQEKELKEASLLIFANKQVQ